MMNALQPSLIHEMEGNKMIGGRKEKVDSVHTHWPREKAHILKQRKQGFCGKV
jgi:hypothetical protein